MMTASWAVLGGFVLDAIFGDPAWLPHPVVYMGKAISRLEKFLRTRLPKTPQGELLGGAVAYWTPENPSNDFPRPAQTNFYNYLGYQTLNYIDGSYWKIKTVSLGYTFPKSLTSKLGVSKLRAYVTANNLFSFAKNHLIQDYDAERGGSAKAPLQRQFIFGLNLDF